MQKREALVGSANSCTQKFLAYHCLLAGLSVLHCKQSAQAHWWSYHRVAVNDPTCCTITVMNTWYKEPPREAFSLQLYLGWHWTGFHQLRGKFGSESLQQPPLITLLVKDEIEQQWSAFGASILLCICVCGREGETIVGFAIRALQANGGRGAPSIAFYFSFICNTMRPCTSNH